MKQKLCKAIQKKTKTLKAVNFLPYKNTKLYKKHFCLTVFSHCENKDVHPQNPDCSIDHGVYIIMFCVV